MSNTLLGAEVTGHHRGDVEQGQTLTGDGTSAQPPHWVGAGSQHSQEPAVGTSPRCGL